MGGEGSFSNWGGCACIIIIKNLEVANAELQLS